MTLTIDALLATDVATVAAIEARQHLTPWHAASFDDALRNAWHTRVLRDATEVLGYLVAMTTGDDEELLTLTVLPEAEGQGYGRLLLDSWTQDAVGRGAERLFLEVRQSNHRAIHLYESAGFTISGMRRNYYRIPADPAQGRVAAHEDAVLMVRTLKEHKT